MCDAPGKQISRTLTSTKIRGVPKSEFFRESIRVDKGGGEEGRGGGRVNRPCAGRGGKNEGKRVGGKGPESTPKKLRFWYPSDLGTL